MARKRKGTGYFNPSTVPAGPLDCKAGDLVAYSAEFLRNTGQVTGEAGSYRGVILDAPDRLGGLDPARFAVVEWQGNIPGDHIQIVNRCNLAKVGPNLRFCAS